MTDSLPQKDRVKARASGSDPYGGRTGWAMIFVKPRASRGDPSASRVRIRSVWWSPRERE